jgi:hypothetical protein
MSRLVSETSLDLYAYATFTSPDGSRVPTKMTDFVDRLQQIDSRLPLRTVPLEIAIFAPTAGRSDENHGRALGVQQDAIAAWNEEIATRFSGDDRAMAICDVELRR